MEQKTERKFPVYVVQIPDEYTIIINYGKEDNNDFLYDTDSQISIGDTIKVIQPGKEVVDPKTKDFLGYYDLIKSELEIVEMYENFSVCKDVQRENMSTMTRVLSPMFLEKTSVTYKELNVSNESITGKDQLDQEIRLGDPVIF